MSAITRNLIIRDESIRTLAESAIRNLQIDPEHPIEVIFREHKSKRRNEQNSFYWVRLNEISNQCYIGGRRYNPETLHEHCKREYLPEDCYNGMEKWKFLPNGDRFLRMSTTDLNTSEFANYLTQVEAWGSELGVMFSSDR